MKARDDSKEATPSPKMRALARGCPTCGHAPLSTLKERDHLLVLGCPRCGTRTFDYAST